MIEEQYTVKELSHLFKKSVRTIRRWIEEGLFPNARRIKGGVLVPERDVQTLLQQYPPSSPTTRRMLSSGL